MQPYNYRPRQNQYSGSLDDEIGAYAGEEITPRNQRPARKLGNLDQAIMQQRRARQQAIEEARARQQEKLANVRQTRTSTTENIYTNKRYHPRG
jgi:hypothetical protein